MKPANYFVSLILLLCTVVPSFASKTDSLIDILNRKSDPHDRIRIYFDIALEYQNVSPDSLMLYARKIESTDVTSNLKDYYFHSLMFTYYRQTGEITPQLNHALRSYQSAMKLKDEKKIADALNNLGIAYMASGEQDSAIRHFQLALEKSEQLSDDARVKRILVNYANILVSNGELGRAKEIAIKGISIDSIFNDSHGLAISYKLLGNIGFYESKYDEAVDAYQKSLQLFEQLNDTVNLINVANNLAVVYENIQDLNNAAKLHLQNLDLIEMTGIESRKISVLINLGNIYDKQGKKKERLKLLDEALSIAVRFNDHRRISLIYNNLGNSAYYNGNYQEALTYFENALLVNIQNGNKQEETVCNTNIGWAQLKLGNVHKALDAFNRSVKLADEIESLEKRMLALDGISDVYVSMGNYKKALEYKEMVFALNDSILGEKTRKRIAELQTRYDTEKKIREIEKLKQTEQANRLILSEKELTINKLNLQRTIFAMSAILIILVTSSVIMWLKIKKEKEKAIAVHREREAGLEAVFYATEEERKRIAKDLHDSVGQQLSALKMSWQHFNVTLQHNPEVDQVRIESMTKILNDVITEVRDISHQMMPRILQESGIIPSIQDMLEKVFKNTSVSYTFEHFGIDTRMSEKTEIGLFRICQELVSNIIKHASATQVHVQLFKNTQMLVLLVEDNGYGINTENASKGIGLLNISSRAETIHGEFNLEPSPISGTLATIRIPINNL